MAATMPIISVIPQAATSTTALPAVRSVTERKRAANRANAKKSTGPRIAAGKARVAQNACRPGLNASLSPCARSLPRMPPIRRPAAPALAARPDPCPPSPDRGIGRAGDAGAGISAEQSHRANAKSASAAHQYRLGPAAVRPPA
jgi:hypothetical protein